MNVVAFVAEDAGSALAQVHERLGPEAVIVSVRKVRPEGISWFWSRGKIEVTACVPRHPPEERQNTTTAPRPTVFAARPMALERPVPRFPNGRWRSIEWLESNGLLPAFTRQLEESARVLYRDKPPSTMQNEWAAITDLIICHWLPSRQAMAGTGRPHVFIGPPGSGKTTALCKWMSSALFLNEHTVRVWRLDGESANDAGLLSLHCELAGVPVERFWEQPQEEADLQLIDLPGVDPQNEAAMSVLSEQLSLLPHPHIHLVLNAAYENSILFEHFRAFEHFGLEDIIFTHLDEEHRRVKLWNFVLGTKCPISFLSAGQKIPGEFRRAEPSLLFPQKNIR